MKVLLFGPRGYFGQQFLKIYNAALQSDADIADAAAVAHTLDGMKPDVVINCAGKTGRPNVDWCEDHKMETLRSNVTGSLVLLEECGKRGIYWVHLSTGCIYEGNKGTPLRSGGVYPEQSRGAGQEGFTEEDPPNFFGSFYSRTKGWIDQILKEFPVLQLRLRMPFDDTPNERNLITKLLRYPRILDVQNSLTYLPDFLAVAAELIKRRRTGTYNVTNPGSLSPYEIMQMYKEIVDPSHTFERLTLKELPTAVKAGRSNCLLSTAKLEREGLTMQPVKGAMRRALQAYAKAK